MGTFAKAALSIGGIVAALAALKIVWAMVTTAFAMVVGVVGFLLFTVLPVLLLVWVTFRIFRALKPKEQY